MELGQRGIIEIGSLVFEEAEANAYTATVLLLLRTCAALGAVLNCLENRPRKGLVPALGVSVVVDVCWAVEQKPCCREPRVRTANDNYFSDLFISDKVEMLSCSIASQELIRQNDSVWLRSHATEMFVEVWVELLSPPVRKHYSLGPKLNLNFRPSDHLEPTSPAAPAALNQFHFHFLPVCSCNDLAIIQQLNRCDCVAWKEYFAFGNGMDKLQYMVASVVHQHADC